MNTFFYLPVTRSNNPTPPTPNPKPKPPMGPTTDGSGEHNPETQPSET